MVVRIFALTRRYRSERGIALLATMMAIALMMLLVIDFTTSSALGYLSAANQANELRATYLARSGVNVGLALLAEDTRMQQAQPAGSPGSTGATPQSGPSDSLNSIWAQPFPPMPVEGGMASLSIVDEARKFDINKIITGAQPGAIGSGAVQPGQVNPGAVGPGAVQPGQPDPNAVAQLARLLALLNISPDIVPAIIDWLDADSIETPGGAEADYYLRLIPPYEPRNGPMPTIGDLRMIKGIDDATFMVLKNYLTVVPEVLVNANTALPEVLACLEPELTQNLQVVQQIMQARSIRPFAQITDLFNEVPGAASLQDKLQKDLTLQSTYFTISGLGAYAGARKLVTATFKRNGDGTASLASWQED